MIRRHASFALLVAAAACASMSNDFDRQLLQPPGNWLAEPADLGLGAEPFEISIRRRSCRGSRHRCRHRGRIR